MNSGTRSLIEILQASGIRPSAQRIAVIRYLSENFTHPTAEEIFQGVLPEYPTISLTTIYNTLKLLEDKGCIISIDIDPTHKRFDFNTTPHAHCMCEICGAIYDYTPAQIPAPPPNFKCTNMQIIFKGICHQCSKANSSHKKHS